MKKLILLLCFCVSGIASAQVITIPDVNFKNALVNTFCADINGDSVIDDDVDTNNDGEIQISEALAVTVLDVSNQYISSFDGISYFSNLSNWSCSGNQLSSLNLSGLSNLSQLNCSYNQISSLNLLGATSLNKLYCSYNQISSLNLSGLTSLAVLDCAANQLSNLDLSVLTSLVSLNCYGNQLSNLDILGQTSLEVLVCQSNQLSSLNVSGLIHLNQLNCGGNQISNLDVSGLINLNQLLCSTNQLSSLNASGLTTLSELDCSYNQLNNLNVSGLTNLNVLVCNNNQLSSLNVSGLTNLIRLHCNNNQLSSLSASGLTNLNELYCNDNQIGSLNVLGLTSLRELKCYNNPISNLDLSGLISLWLLDCRNNQLSSLQVSGLYSLGTLSCGNNQISSLDVSGLNNLRALNCDNNQLSSLDLSAVNGLMDLYCGNNQISSLDVSGLFSLTDLECSHNQISSLDVSGLLNLNDLDCSNNQISSLNVSGLTNLFQFNCSYNQISTIDIADLTNLNIFFCTNNQLLSLDASGLNNLIGINCSDNQLTSLFIKNGTNESIDISNNPNLEFICCDATQIPNIQAIVNNNGLTNCTVSSLCSFTPGGIFNTIQGSAIFDSNNNGCDSLDTNIYQFTINITDGVNTGTLIADNNGYFAIPVQAGNYTFTPILPNPNYFTITPSAIQITLPNTGTNTLTPFCITPNGIHHDLEVTILPTTPARPGFDASYSLVYKNNGNQVENGSVSFSFDDVLLDFLNASTAPNTTSTGVLTWNFSNLLPFQSESIGLTFNCNTPTETPPLNAGDTLYFASTITGGQADETPLDNTFDLAQVVVGSYDPNDKTCLEGDIITPEMVGDYVHYMIRFENTGTYAAENVAVSDVIDVSRFDISSLQITASSHSMKTRISNGNEVEFIFEHINLPFDDANNDGYVAFKIKTLASLQLNDTLKNQANIYFDYNAPITTNEAQTVVQYPNSTVSLGFNSNSSTLNLFPNPAESILYIPTDAQITQADIFDMKGALVRSVSVRNNQIEVQGLSSGTYFTRLYSEAKLYSAKFMVK